MLKQTNKCISPQNCIVYLFSNNNSNKSCPTMSPLLYDPCVCVCAKLLKCKSHVKRFSSFMLILGFLSKTIIVCRSNDMYENSEKYAVRCFTLTKQSYWMKKILLCVFRWQQSHKSQCMTKWHKEETLSRTFVVVLHLIWLLEMFCVHVWSYHYTYTLQGLWRDKRPQDKKIDKSWGGWQHYSWGFCIWYKNKFLRGITTQKLERHNDDTTTKRHVLGYKIEQEFELIVKV